MRLRRSDILVGFLVISFGFNDTYSFTSTRRSCCCNIIPSSSLSPSLSSSSSSSSSFARPRWSENTRSHVLVQMKGSQTEEEKGDGDNDDGDGDGENKSALSKIRNAVVSLGVGITAFTAGGLLAVLIALNIPDWKPQPVMLYQIILSDLDRYYVDEVDTKRLLETSVSAMLRSIDPLAEYNDSIQRSKTTTKQSQSQSQYGGVGISITGITKAELQTATPSKDKITSSSSISASTLLPEDAIDDIDEQDDVDDDDDDNDNEVIQAQLQQSRLEKEKQIQRVKARGIRVASAFEGAAFDYGIRVGDKLIKVDDLDIGPNTPLEDVTAALRGPPRTSAQITYQRDGESDQRKVTIPRSIVKIKDVKLATFLDGNNGYIKLKSFSKDATQEVAQALTSLQSQKPLNGLILDLRGNKGGDIQSAVDVASMFAPKGSQIASSKGKNVPIATYKNTGDPILTTTTNIAVVVDEETSSAAEIVAAAIQDLDLGLVIGKDRTKGIGSIQTTVTLPYNAQVKYTSAKYYSPSGRGIQKTYDEDGRAIRNSDRRVYYTKSGREIRDGGGVEADFKVPPRKESNLEFVLRKSDVFQDFASEWGQGNKATSEQFVVDDDTYRKFQTFVAKKQQNGDIKLEGVYNRALSVLRSNLKISGYDDSATRGLTSLQESIVKDVQNDFDKYGPFIKEDIAQAILARQFPDSVLIKRSLATDKQVQAALALVGDKGQYETILAQGSSIANKFIASRDES